MNVKDRRRNVPVDITIIGPDEGKNCVTGVKNALAKGG